MTSGRDETTQAFAQKRQPPMDMGEERTGEDRRGKTRTAEQEGDPMETGEFRGFEVELQDPGIAVITFNQPDRMNGMTQALKRDLVETLLQAQMDDAVRVVVFTGSGRAFSAGDDISNKPRRGGGRALVPDIPGGHRDPIGTYEGLRSLSQTLNQAVRSLDKLSIAAINGAAIQTGLSLALACDFRIASTAARLGSGTIRFGLLPDEGGQFLLVQVLGVAKTMDFLMRGRIVSGEEAFELGLVHEVTSPDTLMEQTMKLASELANGPQVAMRLLKKTVYNAAEMTFAHALDDIAAKTAISDHHPDAREGVRSFQEKRAPRFNQPRSS
jgi:2-(1,2-epoxy-1,2-dihydrophenyl)acetyl-CoA isomerase